MKELKKLESWEVLPAHAGMIPFQTRQLHQRTSAPRTCGDDPVALDGFCGFSPCSPHMRG